MQFFTAQTRRVLFVLFCSLAFASCLFSQASVIDGTGSLVTAATQPKRIVSLSPAATEILFAVGAGNAVVGRTVFCNYPPEAANIPSLGGFDGKTFSLETILAFKPDFVYANAGMHDHLLPALARYKIPVFVSNAHTIDEVLNEVSSIGTITGHEQTARECIARIKERLEDVRLAAAGKSKVKIYWEVWSEPYMSVGNRSFIHDLCHAAGGQNIFSDIPQAYPVISEESILARNPDIILLPSDSSAQAQDITSRRGWRLVNAVQNSSIFKLDADIVSRSGPRIAQAVELIAAALERARQQKTK